MVLGGISTADSTSHVLALLKDLGYEVSPDAIRNVPAIGVTAASARITVEDKDFAKTVCAEIKSRKRMGQDQGLSAVPAPPKLSGLTSTRRVSCKKVLLSWIKPVRLVWLNFGHHGIAERTSVKFNSGKYKVCGQIVSADSPTGSSSPRNHAGWTVVLRNVPSNTSRADVERAVSADYDKPRHIEMGEPSNTYDTAAAPVLVESLLTHIGPVDFTMRNDAQVKRFKAVAIFTDEADAREAVRAIQSRHIGLSTRLLRRLSRRPVHVGRLQWQGLRNLLPRRGRQLPEDCRPTRTRAPAFFKCFGGSVRSIVRIIHTSSACQVPILPHARLWIYLSHGFRDAYLYQMSRSDMYFVP